jgi:hypothetical protein
VAEAAAGGGVVFVAWYGLGGGPVDGLVGAVVVFAVGVAVGMRKIAGSRRG